MDLNRGSVLYISYDGMTDPLGQSQVIPYLDRLTRLGFRFTILSVEKKERLKNSGDAVRAILEKTGIVWETLLYSSKPPLFSKWNDQRRLNARAVQLQKEKKFDMIHCRSYVAAASGLKLARKFGVPFLFDMRGFWVDERVDSGLWNRNNPVFHFLYWWYKKKERTYFSKAAQIISLTEKGKEELIVHYGVASEKITVIPCCADLAHFNYKRVPKDLSDALRNKLGILPGTRVFSYLGSLGGWYMTEEMLDFYAVAREHVSPAVFLLITHDNRKKIEVLALQRGIPVSELIVQPAVRKDVPLFLSLSNWNIFFIRDLYSKKASSPTKQGEVMGMGIPVICNDIGDTGQIIREAGAGMVIDRFDREEYEKRAAELTALSVIPMEKIRRSAFQYYDLEEGVNRYLRTYEQILNPRTHESSLNPGKC